jgi:hypothetical protein
MLIRLCVAALVTAATVSAGARAQFSGVANDAKAQDVARGRQAAAAAAARNLGELTTAPAPVALSRLRVPLRDLRRRRS